MPRTDLYASTRVKSYLLLTSIAIITILGLPTSAHAHFSYSDPRIIHVAEYGKDQSVILIRMPAPLALLPDDWQGSDDTRDPPFGLVQGDQTVLNLTAVANGGAAMREQLNKAVTLWAGGRHVGTRVEQWR
ncbi:MAG: hypothetical protein KDA57_23515, partial [Planctomycetales bacterium]|nr:hypothetical protein [Planctomycetales bacterium]